MLTNKGFMKWADESVVVLVSHNELGHEELEVEEDGETLKKCPLYPGLTCRQHLDIAVATDNSRDETLPVIPFVRLHPNSFLVLPTDKVEAIAEEDQFSASAIKKQVGVFQKAAGKAMDRGTWLEIETHMTSVRTAIDEETWLEALQHWAAAWKKVKKPPTSMQALLDKHLTLIHEEVEFLFEEYRDDTKSPKAERVAGVQELIESVDVKVGEREVPILATMKAWLEKLGTGG